MGRNALKTGDECLSYVKTGMNSYLQDPPTSPYQRGYLMALLDVKKFLTKG